MRDILSDSQAKLADIYQNQVSCNQHLSSANWFRYGNTCSKNFFDFHKLGQKKTLLRELETESGSIRGQSDLTHHVIEFYTNLYSSKAHLPSTQESQARCWESVPARVTTDANASLTQNLTLEEVHKAIQALPKSKGLGHDRIPIKFFQACASEVAPTLLKAYTAILAFGKASAYINRGLITLIPKTGDRSKPRIGDQLFSWGVSIKFWPKPSPGGYKPSSQILSSRIKLVLYKAGAYSTMSLLLKTPWTGPWRATRIWSSSCWTSERPSIG